MMPLVARTDDEWPYRMKDLCEMTGLGRQAIHFYIQAGLLPPGNKTGRNMAYYGEEHIERLRVIKRLQSERFLPLKAIKAILDDQQSTFTNTQRHFLLDVKQHLTLAKGTDQPSVAHSVDEVCARTNVPRADVERMVERELIGARRDDDGSLWIGDDDLWLIEAWGEALQLGFVQQFGFAVDDLLLFEEIVAQLFQREAQMLAPRLPEITPARAAEMIEKVLPVIHHVLTGMHRAKIRNFLASI
jgi:DNA-binding transcriptional MerR regulator